MLRVHGLVLDRLDVVPPCDAADHIFVTKVPGETALSAWRIARQAVSETGRWPVITGDPREGAWADPEDLCAGGYEPSQAIASAADIDSDSWFNSRAKYLGVRDDELEVASPLPHYDHPKDTFTAPFEVLSGEPLEFVLLALMPDSDHANVPAYLEWGGFNDAPLPHEHVALFNRWHDQYGAEVVAMTWDVVEMAVTEPPDNERAAIELAREQFLYAPDIVWQGVGDLSSLAAALQDATAWYFWWD